MPEIDISWLSDKLAPQVLAGIRPFITETESFPKHQVLISDSQNVKVILSFLAPSFEILMDLFGIDYQKMGVSDERRFAVVYNLFSLSRAHHLFVKSYLPSLNPSIESMVGVFKGANWFEREAFDLYGIQFRGHPNLKRILCHEEFEGHALRKDYPADRYQRLKHVASGETLS